MLIFPGTQAWIAGCPGACDGIDGGSKNSTNFSFPSTLVFYTTGIPVNLMGQSGLSDGASASDTWLGIGIPCLVLGLIVAAAGSMLMAKASQRNKQRPQLARNTAKNGAGSQAVPRYNPSNMTMAVRTLCLSNSNL